MDARRPSVLLVEDSPGDARLMRIAFAEALPGADLRVVGDGDAALGTLRSGPPPDLVLLDLNLPRMAGHEVLAALRASGDDAVRRVRVIMLTASGAPEEAARSRELGADGHIVKPASLDGLYELVAALGRDWLGQSVE
jgi:CheY-like chemotaxis protein